MKKVFLLFFASMMAMSAMAWDALYLVGDGTSVGWNAGDPLEMNKIAEDEFEWTGQFYDGQVKILSGKDFGSQSYGPARDVYSTTSDNGKESFNQLVRNCVYEAQTFHDGNSYEYDDYKFGVSAGYYTIHINTTTMSISTWPMYLCPTGDGCNYGWVGQDQHTAKWKETDFGSGIYRGDVSLKTDGNQREFFFTVDNKYEYYVGPSTFNEWSHFDLENVGTYDLAVRQSSEGEKRFYILDGGNEKSFHVTVDLKENKMMLLPTTITVKAQVSYEALKLLKTAGDKPKCYFWGISQSNGEYLKDVDMELNDGWWTATVDNAYEPVNFIIHDASWGTNNIKTPDMTNDGNGYSADKYVDVFSKKNSDGNLNCFHNDNAVKNTNADKEFTVSVYVEDAGWEDVYFFTQGVASGTDYDYEYWHAEKGDDNWYSYTFKGVENLKWVATATTENWDTQVNDIESISEDMYIYVSSEKKNIYDDKWVHKFIPLTGKDQKKELTFEFKFDGAAHTSWGDANPVGLFYWQNYAYDGEEAADHAGVITMTADGESVYSATITAFNNVKFCVQSDLEHGYQGEGHYTVAHDAAEEATGFAESKKFWLKDEGAGHFVALTENFDFTPAEMTIALNKDGFASFYWDKNYKLTGADAYVARVEGDVVELSKLEGNGIIPARSAIILYGSRAGEAIATETLDAATGYDYENALRGTLETIQNIEAYVLAEYGEPAVTCFLYVQAAWNVTLPAYRAYLPTTGTGAPMRIRFATENATGIDENENADEDENVNKVMVNGKLLIIRGENKYNALGVKLQ